MMTSHSETIPSLVLVVEDDDLKFRMVLRILTAEGMHVVRATCTADAKRLLATEKYMVAVFDYDLGVETTEELYDVARQQGLPFCVFSGSAQADTGVRDVEWIESTEYMKLRHFVTAQVLRG